jgi:hypothetical protein
LITVKVLPLFRIGQLINNGFDYFDCFHAGNLL